MSRPAHPARPHVAALGPLLVVVAGEPVELGTRADRVVLGALALCAGRIVPLSVLVGLTYGATEPPSGGRRGVQTAVWRLRQRLGADVITTIGDAYRLDEAACDLDVLEFEQAVARGRALMARGDPDAAVEVLVGGLALWRGRPLADAHADAAELPEVPRLVELHVGAIEDHAEALVMAGRLDDGIIVLDRLVAAEPAREHAWRLLADAWLEVGRPTEAQRALDRARAALVDVGLEPGSELQAAAQRAASAVTKVERPLRRPAPDPRGAEHEVAGGRPRPIVIDCDPGMDDAISLAMAVASPELHVLGVTTTYGNVGLDNTTHNALRVLDWLGSAVQVFRGVDRSLLGPAIDAAAYHGATGLEAPAIGEPTRSAERRHGIEFLIDTVLHHPEPVTVVALGPLTNLALAMRLEPRIVERIAEVVLMGGSTDYGNDSPAAEFNMCCDPHAAQIVFSSGVSIAMFGLNVTHQVIATPHEMAMLRAVGNKSAAVVADMIACFEAVYIERCGFAGAALHDPCTIGYLLDPEIFTLRAMRVDVDTNAGISFGRTVHDIWGLSGLPQNTRVAITADSPRFFTLLRRCLERLR